MFNRENCPVCGKDTKVTEAGLIASHRFDGEVCEGSGVFAMAQEPMPDFVPGLQMIRPVARA